MDERQKLYDDLKRYRTVRDLTTDEAAIEDRQACRDHHGSVHHSPT